MVVRWLAVDISGKGCGKKGEGDGRNEKEGKGKGKEGRGWDKHTHSQSCSTPTKPDSTTGYSLDPCRRVVLPHLSSGNCATHKGIPSALFSSYLSQRFHHPTHHLPRRDIDWVNAKSKREQNIPKRPTPRQTP